MLLRRWECAMVLKYLDWGLPQSLGVGTKKIWQPSMLL